MKNAKLQSDQPFDSTAHLNAPIDAQKTAASTVSSEESPSEETPTSPAVVSRDALGSRRAFSKSLCLAWISAIGGQYHSEKGYDPLFTKDANRTVPWLYAQLINLMTHTSRSCEAYRQVDDLSGLQGRSSSWLTRLKYVCDVQFWTACGSGHSFPALVSWALSAHIGALTCSLRAAFIANEACEGQGVE